MFNKTFIELIRDFVQEQHGEPIPPWSYLIVPLFLNSPSQEFGIGVVILDSNRYRACVNMEGGG